jgi:ribosomal protein S6--L-glutamate ligase
VKPNFKDYTKEERDKILSAEKILYPTVNYAQFFTTLEKSIFPSLETHLYADEKIKQTTLFYMLGIPHPRTRVYFSGHHDDILEDFKFPFVAKIPRSSACGRGVFKINDAGALKQYLSKNPVAYIQEFLPHDRDLRAVLVNYEPVLVYWREKNPREFRANLSQGGKLCFDNIPLEAVHLAQQSAMQCKFDDVGLDLIYSKGQWYVIEANMKYGRQALKSLGLDLKEIIRQKLLSGKL